MWKPITGYLNNYRINELGDVQQFRRGKWISLTVNTRGPRAEVRLRGLDGKQKRVGVFGYWTDAFAEDTPTKTACVQFLKME